MRLRTSRAEIVQTAGVILLIWTVAASANQRDYGADYTDDGHSHATRIMAEHPAARSSALPAARSRPDHRTPQSEQSATLSRKLRAPRTYDVPRRGLSKHAVRAAYGPPLTARDAVGQPPITRWDYRQFHVYFEYDRVIHSVIPGHPEPIEHTAQLK